MKNPESIAELIEILKEFHTQIESLNARVKSLEKALNKKGDESTSSKLSKWFTGGDDEDE